MKKRYFLILVLFLLLLVKPYNAGALDQQKDLIECFGQSDDGKVKFMYYIYKDTNELYTGIYNKAYLEYKGEIQSTDLPNDDVGFKILIKSFDDKGMEVPLNKEKIYSCKDVAFGYWKTEDGWGEYDDQIYVALYNSEKYDILGKEILPESKGFVWAKDEIKETDIEDVNDAINNDNQEETSDPNVGGDPDLGTIQKGCEVIPEVVRKWINNILKFVRYVALALVIALGALDFMKAAGDGEPDAMKKAGQSFMKRMIAVVILFLLPVIVDFILNMVNIYGVDTNNIDCL